MILIRHIIAAILNFNIVFIILFYILGVVKRNPLFFHSISCKNNGFFLLHLISSRTQKKNESTAEYPNFH